MRGRDLRGVRKSLRLSTADAGVYLVVEETAGLETVRVVLECQGSLTAAWMTAEQFRALLDVRLVDEPSAYGGSSDTDLVCRDPPPPPPPAPPAPPTGRALDVEDRPAAGAEPVAEAKVDDEMF